MDKLPYPDTHEEVVTMKDQARREAAAENKIGKMHKLYDRHPELMAICGDCKQFIGIQHGKVYWKCKLYGITGGHATDWRKGWHACGRFEK